MAIENQQPSGWNQLTGYIEIYPSGTTFSNDLPYKISEIDLNTEGAPLLPRVTIGANGASKQPLTAKIDFLNNVKIESSFKTLTDTCEIIIPRIEGWIIKGERNINNFSLYTPNALGENVSEDNNLLFDKGNVVRVFLGYDYQDKLMFHGYVSGAATTSPFTVKLEDAMWLLKQKTVNAVYKPKDGQTQVALSDFIGDLLDGTGVKLSEYIDPTQMFFGKEVRFRQSTVARVMSDIKERGLSVFVENGKLIIGRTAFDSTLTPFISSGSEADYDPPLINIEWNVPKGGTNLRFSPLEKKTKMVTVQRFISNTRSIQLNVALDPNEAEDILVPVAINDSKNEDTSPNQEALTNWLIAKYGVTVDTNGYSQKTATMDPVKPLTRKFNSKTQDNDFKELIEEMLEYGKSKFYQFYDTGLSGSVTIFGDYGLKTGQSIKLFDAHNSEINGEYLVSDIATEWGFGGYRQTLKLSITIKGANAYIDNIPATNVFQDVPQDNSNVA